jgi:hypothetical protein
MNNSSENGGGQCDHDQRYPDLSGVVTFTQNITSWEVGREKEKRKKESDMLAESRYNKTINQQYDTKQNKFCNK